MKKKRLEKKLTLEEVGNLVGVGKSTVRKWENGLIENMGRDKIVKLSKALEMSPLSLLGISEDESKYSNIMKKIIDTSSQLTQSRQKKVYHYAEKQLIEQNTENEVIDVTKHVVKKNSVKKSGVDVEVVALASAGHGCYAFDKGATYAVTVESAPSNYDLAFQVSGHSMEPTFTHNDVIFVKRVPELYSGQIGVIEINNEIYVKKVKRENQRLRLISINSSCDKNGNRLYSDFYADEKDEVYIIGKVIM